MFKNTHLVPKVKKIIKSHKNAAKISSILILKSVDPRKLIKAKNEENHKKNHQ